MLGSVYTHHVPFYMAALHLLTYPVKEPLKRWLIPPGFMQAGRNLVLPGWVQEAPRGLDISVLAS